jgi:hypothetical protein
MTEASLAADVAQTAQTLSTTTPSPAPQRFVICMKWGRKYGPEYVNRLYAMVRRRRCQPDNHVDEPFQGDLVSVSSCLVSLII